MNKDDIGTITEVKDLRSVWPNEAKDFTQWLAQEENLNQLGDKIGISLKLFRTEGNVGKYFADIVALTGFDDDEKKADKVIIENQLGATDHDHLGKCIVYAAGQEASTIIWIAKECNDEHIEAVNWLNKHFDEAISFYLVQIKLVRIGDSKPAPQFEIICKPNTAAKTTRDNGKGYADTELRMTYLKFWEGFNTYLDAKNSKFPKRKADSVHYHDLPVNSRKCHLSLNVDHKSGVLKTQIWIPDDKNLFNDLLSHKDEIEADLQYSVKFDSKSKAKASCIYITTDEFSSNYHDGDFDPCYAWLLEKANDFDRVFRKYLH